MMQNLITCCEALSDANDNAFDILLYDENGNNCYSKGKTQLSNEEVVSLRSLIESGSQSPCVIKLQGVRFICFKSAENILYGRGEFNVHAKIPNSDNDSSVCDKSMLQGMKSKRSFNKDKIAPNEVEKYPLDETNAYHDETTYRRNPKEGIELPNDNKKDVISNEVGFDIGEELAGDNEEMKRVKHYNEENKATHDNSDESVDNNRMETGHMKQNEDANDDAKVPIGNNNVISINIKDKQTTTKHTMELPSANGYDVNHKTAKSDDQEKLTDENYSRQNGMCMETKAQCHINKYNSDRRGLEQISARKAAKTKPLLKSMNKGRTSFAASMINNFILVIYGQNNGRESWLLKVSNFGDKLEVFINSDGC